MLKWLLFCLLFVSQLGTAQTQTQTQTWYFIRHFEKQSGNNPSLTTQGKVRAENLARYFANKPLSAVFSTQYMRTLETAAPVARSKQLDVQSYDPSKLGLFAKELKSTSHILVVGHSNTTPALIQLMGGGLFEIAESDFGMLYVLKIQDQQLTVSEVTIPL